MAYIMTAEEYLTAYEADEIVAKAEAQYEIDHDVDALEAAFDRAEAMCLEFNRALYDLM